MSDTFLQLLSRVGSAALVRVTLGLVLCLALASVSRKGAAGVLPAVALVYSMLGTLTLSLPPAWPSLRIARNGTYPWAVGGRQSCLT